jgi:hypothetical protein
MLLIRCTKKLLDEITIKKPESMTSSVDSFFFQNWHANLIRVSRRKCVLFTNDQTLYSFFVPALKKPHFQNLARVFMTDLMMNLEFEGLSGFIPKIAHELSPEHHFAKTENKKVLGYMNSLAYMILFYINRYDVLTQQNLMQLNKEINRNPTRGLEWRYSIESLRRKLEI